MLAKKDGEDISFTKPTLLSETPNVGKDYLFSMSTTPGELELSSVRFLRNALLIVGSAEFNLNQTINVPANQVIYIGNITASVLPRKGDEPRAGSVIPLIDQAVTGFSSGTFVVDIKDNYNEDIAILRKEYPFLADKKISKMILSKWKHPEK